jgi:acyl-coenzyme A synthetase/AMP-(fatty) acid ligase
LHHHKVQFCITNYSDITKTSCAPFCMQVSFVVVVPSLPRTASNKVMRVLRNKFTQAKPSKI